MQVETRLEIQDSARRLLPSMLKAAIWSAACAVLGAILMAVAVYLAATTPAPIVAVTDSGSIHPIPEKK